MPPTFAKATTVAPEKSRAEIERVLMKYGADQFMNGWDSFNRRAVLGFRAHSRMVRFEVQMPKESDFKWRYGVTPAQKKRTLEQAERQRWRALLLVIKAKLEAVESKISTFETEFLAHIVIGPHGETVGDAITPQIDQIYLNGMSGQLLLGDGR